MCGIVGCIGTKKAVPVLISGLLNLEYRGYDSAGIAVLNSNNRSFNDEATICLVKNKGRVKNLQESKELLKLEESNIGIAHTRWATHGVPSKENSHPHLDNSKTFAVVHNGIIENYDEIKKFLYNNGYELYSETDTEVIPNLIHYYYKKTQDILVSVASTLKQLNGSYAIEIISPLFKDEIIVAKKDSPMVIGIGDKENYIASDIPAILNYTKNFYFMEDEEIAIIKQDEIEFYNLELKHIQKELKNIEWDAVASEKNGYEDYMLKEIFEQPKAIRETIGISLNDKKVNLPLDDIEFKKINRIYIVACGTAMHSGMAIKNTMERLTKIPTDVEMASEFRYKKPLIDKKTLCIFVTQSGETADTIAALKLAKENKSTTIAIVNAIGSSITRIADYVLYTHAGPEIAVASTKAYTCQVVLLNILSIYMAERLLDEKNNKNTNKKVENKESIEEIEMLKKDILQLPRKVKETLKLGDSIKELANQVYKKKDMFFIGRGIDYSVCLEGSLKLKEISYIHSEAYAAGELKHGPIALIESGVTVLGVITDQELTLKTVNNVEEVITRGANVIVITNQKIENNQIQNIIKIPNCNVKLSPILSVIPLQLFAYYISKAKNLNVDKPRNLAKSVTVE